MNDEQAAKELTVNADEPYAWEYAMRGIRHERERAAKVVEDEVDVSNSSFYGYAALAHRIRKGPPS